MLSAELFMGISSWHRGCPRCSSASIRRFFRGWPRLTRTPSHLAVFRGRDLEETHDPLGIAADLDLPPIPSSRQFRLRPPVDEHPEAGIPEPPGATVPGSLCVDRCRCGGGGVVLRMADVAGGEQAARVMLNGRMASMRCRGWRTGAPDASKMDPLATDLVESLGFLAAFASTPVVLHGVLGMRLRSSVTRSANWSASRSAFCTRILGERPWR